jgi:hypothetical protein
MSLRDLFQWKLQAPSREQKTLATKHGLNKTAGIITVREGNRNRFHRVAVALAVAKFPPSTIVVDEQTLLHTYKHLTRLTYG